MLRIVEAESKDKEAAVDITLAAYAEYEHDGGPNFWQAYSANIKKAILSGTSTNVLLAKDGDTIKGSVLLCDPKDSLTQHELPEMRLLAVPPEFRNQGIAGLLIDECERRANKSGGLTLHTTRLMTTARKMYERRGYTRFPETDFEPVPGFVVWGYKKLF